jgi:hypothetical protein
MAYDSVTLRAAATATSNSFTSAGFGTPSGAVAIVTRATANATAKAGQMVCIGKTDFTSQMCSGGQSEDNSGSTDSDSWSSNTKFLRALDADGTTVLFEGTVATTTDGLIITWSTDPAEGYLITLFMLDSDWSCDVGEIKGNSTEGSSVSYTGSAFEAEMGIFSYARLATTGAAVIGASQFTGFGVADNGASITQHGFGFDDPNGQGTSLARFRALSAATCGRASGEQFQVTAFGATGYTLKTLNSGGGYYVQSFLFSSGGNKVHALWDATPPATAPNDTAVTLTGMTPEFAIAISTAAAAYDTYYQVAPAAATVGIGFKDGSNEYSVSLSNEDAAGTTDTQNLVDTKLIHMPGHNGVDTDGNAVEATGAFSSEALTLSYTKLISTNDIAFGLAWGDAPAAGGVAPHFMHYQRLRRAG